MKKSLQISLIIFLSILSYFNSLFNGFAWDDELLVRDNPHIRSTDKAIHYGFSNDLMPPEAATFKTNYYRPLQLISYALDFFLWQNLAAGYHTTNLLLHLANALLAYLLIFLISQNLLISFLSALFFAVHPINHSAVAYISGRADLLAGFFILFSIYLFILQRQKGYAKINRIFLLALACFFAALFSKEYALVLPGLFLAYDGSYGYFNRRRIKEYLLFLVPILGYASLRFFALGFAGFLPGKKYPHFLFSDIGFRLMVFLDGLFSYLKILLLPVNLHMERTYSSVAPGFNFSFLLWLVVLTGGLYFCLKIKKQKPIFIFFFLWFILLLFSQSHFFLQEITLAEHFCYLACLGIFVFVSLAYQAISQRLSAQDNSRRLLTVTLGLLIVFYSGMTAIHNLNWKDSLTLYKWTLQQSPSSLRMHFNLANEYLRRGRLDLAYQEYNNTTALFERLKAACQIKKCNLTKEILHAVMVAHFNLAVFYVRAGEADAAYQQYQNALKVYAADRQVLEAFQALLKLPKQKKK